MSEVAGVDYQQVSFSGHFDSGREVLIGPRSFIDGRGEQGGGGIISARDSKVGFLVVSPFTLTTGERILINRSVLLFSFLWSEGSHVSYLLEAGFQATEITLKPK